MTKVQKKTITRGERFEDEDGSVWLYQETITNIETTYTKDECLVCYFLFVTEDYTDSWLIGYYDLERSLTRVKTDES